MRRRDDVDYPASELYARRDDLPATPRQVAYLRGLASRARARGLGVPLRIAAALGVGDLTSAVASAAIQDLERRLGERRRP